jgi:hypothetical protein
MRPRCEASAKRGSIGIGGSGACDTAIAEKFQAMVYLGRAKSRIKDFYDEWVLSKAYGLDLDRLAKAIAACG